MVAAVLEVWEQPGLCSTTFGVSHLRIVEIKVVVLSSLVVFSRKSSHFAFRFGDFEVHIFWYEMGS